MTPSRRNFLAMTASVAAASVWASGLLGAQRQAPGIPFPRQGNPFPTPRSPFPDGSLDPAPPPRRNPAQQMKMNRDEIAKDMERLKAAVADLEKEFDVNDTTEVLSLGAVRKTEEIEKLARHIRGLVRG
jgi:hypothetical protein